MSKEPTIDEVYQQNRLLLYTKLYDSFPLVDNVYTLRLFRSLIRNLYRYTAQSSRFNCRVHTAINRFETRYPEARPWCIIAHAIIKEFNWHHTTPNRTDDILLLFLLFSNNVTYSNKSLGNTESYSINFVRDKEYISTYLRRMYPKSIAKPQHST